GNSNCGSTGSMASITTGSGTPFSSVTPPTIIATVTSGGSNKSCIELIEAIGNGNTGTVTVNVGSGYSVGWADLLQLPSGATVHGTPNVINATSSAATALLTSPGLS